MVKSFVLKNTPTVLLVALAVMVLGMFPISQSVAIDSKRLLVFVTTIVLLGAFSAWTVTKKTLRFRFSPYSLALWVIFGGSLLSTLFTGPYATDDLVMQGGVYLSLSLIALIGATILDKSPITSFSYEKSILTVLSWSVIATGIATILQLLGYGPSQIFYTQFGIQNASDPTLFSLTESPVVAFQVGILTFAGVVGAFLSKKSVSNQQVVSGLLVALSVALFGWFILPVGPDKNLPVFAPISANIAVAQQTLSNPYSALIGVGPNNFSSAYTQLKPLSLNATPLWNVSFSQGRNVPLTWIVTLGLVATFGWVWLAFLIVKRALTDTEARQQPTTWILVAGVVLQLLFPPNITTMSIFFIVLAVWLGTQHKQYTELRLITLINQVQSGKGVATTAPSYFRIITVGVGLVTIALAITSIYGIGQSYRAHYLMFQASRASQQQQVVRSYELQKKAVQIFPYLPQYRRQYASTNLFLATALANRDSLTEQQQQEVLTLIQQAIREGRAATQLRPDDAQNWAVLGQIYSSLTSVANGAAQWAANSYVQAVQTAPTNPVLLVQLGGILYGQQQYTEASQLFVRAIQIKTDYGNAYYNLAQAQKQLNLLTDAEQTYQQLLSILPPGSEEIGLVQTELAQLRKAIAEQPETTEETTQPPASILEESISNQSVIPNTSPALSEGIRSLLETEASSGSSQQSNDEASESGAVAN